MIIWASWVSYWKILRFDPPVLWIMTCTMSIACLHHGTQTGQVRTLVVVQLLSFYAHQSSQNGHLSKVLQLCWLFSLWQPHLSTWHRLKQQLALLGPRVIRGPNPRGGTSEPWKWNAPGLGTHPLAHIWPDSGNVAMDSTSMGVKKKHLSATKSHGNLSKWRNIYKASCC